MKRVFIIHQWGSSPRGNWYPWLKKELAAKGFKVIVPKMPDPDAPKIAAWVAELKRQVGTVDVETYFVGHSVGCQAIIRYLGSQPNRCAKAVFVGGWFLLTPEATSSKAEQRIAKDWLLKPIPFEKASNAMGSAVAILSDDDPYVPLSNKEVFEKTLSAKVMIQKRKGHFEKASGVTELPVVVKELSSRK